MKANQSGIIIITVICCHHHHHHHLTILQLLILPSEWSHYRFGFICHFWGGQRQRTSKYTITGCIAHKRSRISQSYSASSAVYSFLPTACVLSSYEKVYYKTELRKWTKIEKIDYSRKYQENIHWVICFLFVVLHINCAQYNLAICVSLIYKGHIRVEMEYQNLTSLIM